MKHTLITLSSMKSFWLPLGIFTLLHKEDETLPPVFRGVHVTPALVFCVVFCGSGFSFCPFSVELSILNYGF